MTRNIPAFFCKYVSILVLGKRYCGEANVSNLLEKRNISMILTVISSTISIEKCFLFLITKTESKRNDAITNKIVGNNTLCLVVEMLSEEIICRKLLHSINIHILRNTSPKNKIGNKILIFVCSFTFFSFDEGP